MTELRVLAPHDPVPERGHYMIVMRRFAADAPRTTLTEIITSDGHNPPTLSVPVGADGAPLDFAAAVRAARQDAEAQGLAVLYAVDRTAGQREREVLAHGGDHAVHSERLADSDRDEGEPGPDMRDKPR